MKVKEIADIIETAAPISHASSWDNVGLMVGDFDADVNKVMLTLDVTPDVVAQAIEQHCGLIISHHPFIFDGIKNIDFSTPCGSMINLLITNKISVYSCHTNMDSAEIGINTYLAKLYGLCDVIVLEENENNKNIGIGRIGNLKSSVTVKELAEITKSLLNTTFVRIVTNNPEKTVKRIAVASGSCGDLISLAKEKGAEAIITADVKYHQALDALDEDICVIDAGHFPTESFVADILKDILKAANLELVCAKAHDCFEII